METTRAMRTLTVYAFKGGVGKSAISCTTSQHAAINRKLRTLHIDLDGQANSGDTMTAGGYFEVSATTSDMLFTQDTIAIEHAPRVVITVNAAEIRKLERHEDRRNEYATNFKYNLASISDQFDICVIDCPLSQDIRALSAMIACDALISPLELNQEGVSGAVALLDDPQAGISAVMRLNPELDFLGFLPSLVGTTDFQTSNLKMVAAEIGQYMFKGAQDAAMLVPRSIAVAEAAASGTPLFKSDKSTGQKFWIKVRPVFDEIVSRTLNNGDMS